MAAKEANAGAHLIPLSGQIRGKDVLSRPVFFGHIHFFSERGSYQVGKFGKKRETIWSDLKRWWEGEEKIRKGRKDR